MLRLGSPPSDTREMNLDDIFFSRLKLMVIMAKAYLDGCPLGDFRRQAMYENAGYVETEAVDIGGLDTLISEEQVLPHSEDTSEYDFVFFQRVKLLAVMVKAAAKGFPMGDHRKTAMLDNLEAICQTLMFSSQTESISFLKVA